MSRQWGQLAAVGFAVLGVLVLAYFGDRSDPAEIIWTALGAAGSVYAWQVFRRRWLVNEWRKANKINSLFKITCEQHVTLRGLGVGVQFLILVGGIGAMLNWHRLLIISSVIGVAALATFGAWYAERKAEQMSAYVQIHPEG